MRIETPPGEEAQFDFSMPPLGVMTGGLRACSVYSAILSWSRWRLWWFTTSVNREHTLKGSSASSKRPAVSPRCCAPTGWGALGSSQGRRFKLHPPAQEFARFHGTEIQGLPGC